MIYKTYHKEIANSKPNKEYKKKYKVIIIAKEIKREYVLIEFNELFAQITALTKFLDLLNEHKRDRVIDKIEVIKVA